jgi:hypothetical protein
MSRDLGVLREHVYPTGPLVIMLGLFSAHRTSLTRAAAEVLGIQVVFIPSGCTDILQPLDRRVFGVLREHARQLLQIQYHAMHSAKTSLIQMAENLIVSWDRIIPDLINRGWDLYEGEWEELASAESEGSDREFHP